MSDKRWDLIKLPGGILQSLTRTLIGGIIIMKIPRYHGSVLNVLKGSD